MGEHPKYFLVDSQILPEVYLKVTLAKKLLAQGKVKSASEAARAAGISRSAFYKILSTNIIRASATVS